MIDFFLTICLATIFSLLALIHFNWAIGNDFGIRNAIPTKENGEKVINPTKIDSAIVGFGLSCFALFYPVKMDWINVPAPEWVLNYGGWLIVGFFLLRAIGDFKYIGFFKKLRTSDFGIMDTRYYSPLCFIISAIAAILN
ncbi:MAG: DUF3995 domain-containing protein [Reichenbachiella sp.]